MSILSSMDGKPAMLNALHAKLVLFTVNVPMWEVLTRKKLLSQSKQGQIKFDFQTFLYCFSCFGPVLTRAIDNNLYRKIVLFATEIVLKRIWVFQMVARIVDETDERLAIGMCLVAVAVDDELFTNFRVA